MLILGMIIVSSVGILKEEFGEGGFLPKVLRKMGPS